MPDAVLFDQLHITFFRPDPLDEAITAAARAAIEELPFLEAVRDAVRRLLAAHPALAVLDVVVSW